MYVHCTLIEYFGCNFGFITTLGIVQFNILMSFLLRYCKARMFWNRLGYLFVQIHPDHKFKVTIV